MAWGLMMGSWMGSLRGVRPLLTAAAIALLVSAVPSTGHAQSTSVEELERRLQKAKEEKARRDAAATRAKSGADAARNSAEASARTQARLVVSTDAPCTLTVNGNPIGDLRPGGARSVQVPPGEQLVECASSADSTLTVRVTPTVDVGKQQVVDLQMNSILQSAAAAAREHTKAVEIARRFVGEWRALKSDVYRLEKDYSGSDCDGRYIHLNDPNRSTQWVCEYSTCTESRVRRAALSVELDRAGPPGQLVVIYRRETDSALTGEFETWLWGSKRSTVLRKACSSSSRLTAGLVNNRFSRMGTFAVTLGPVPSARGSLATTVCRGFCENLAPGTSIDAEFRFNGQQLELWLSGDKNAAFSFGRE
jgi:hypothetical protein